MAKRRPAPPSEALVDPAQNAALASGAHGDPFAYLGRHKVAEDGWIVRAFRPGAERWFDRQMKALEPFDVTLTFCFTPENCGIKPHHTSPPRCVEPFAEFCAAQVRRYA